MKHNPSTANRPKQPAAASASTRHKRRKRPALRLPTLTLNLDAERLRRLRQISGLMLFGFAAFTLLALSSHLSDGPADQSVLEPGPMPGLSGQPAANIGGALGAWLGQMLISRGFGYAGFLIPLYAFLLALVLLRPRLGAHAAAVFPYVFFLLHWGSSLGDFLNRLGGWAKPELGGELGNSLNDWMSFYIGPFGLGLLLLVALVIFVALRAQAGFPYAELARDWLEQQFPALHRWRLRRQANAANRPHYEDDPARTASPEADAQDPDGGWSSQQGEDVSEDGFIYTIEPVPNAGNGAMDENDGEDGETDQAGGPANSPAETPQPAPVSAGGEEPPASNQRQAKTATAPNPGDIGLTIITPEEEERVEPAASVSAYTTNVEHTETGEELVIAAEDSTSLQGTDTLESQEPYDPTQDLSHYQYPQLSLLDAPMTGEDAAVNTDEVEENKQNIIQTFEDFKIILTDIQATVGPTVTLYEVTPQRGIRVSQITKLQDDIALRLASEGVRIVGQIPGTNRLGIEIPNRSPRLVTFGDVVATRKFQDSEADLPVILGRNISNRVVIADLAKMPHLLMAGATGQGKSVGMNCLISSLLYRKHPSQVKFILIDPKKVELSPYADLMRHFMAKLPDGEEAVITETEDAVRVLNSLCLEMENRYRLLQAARVKDLNEYNEKFRRRRLNPQDGHQYMPYLVVVIDEMADLMMTSGKEAEAPLNRLAAKARAIGIHLIVATQRPDTKVITGTIKNNFPTRISFKVTSRHDSGTILDANGAERLVGKGDMLFLPAGQPLTRLQGPFIQNEEVERLVEHISRQQGYPEAYLLPDVPSENDDNDGEIDMSKIDSMLMDAARVVVEEQSGSTSLIQRRLEIGYPRASRIIEQMARLGIVGPNKGGKPRDVLVHTFADLEQNLSEMGIESR